LDVLRYAKWRLFWAETTSNSEKIKPVTLAVIELRLSEAISQLFNQSVSQKKIPLNIFLKNSVAALIV